MFLGGVLHPNHLPTPQLIYGYYFTFGICLLNFSSTLLNDTTLDTLYLYDTR